MNCPTCDSHDPRLHPAVQFEGEVSICGDPFHGSQLTREAAEKADKYALIEKIRSEARAQAFKVANLNFKRAEALQAENADLKRQLDECRKRSGA